MYGPKRVASRNGKIPHPELGDFKFLSLHECVSKVDGVLGEYSFINDICNM